MQRSPRQQSDHVVVDDTARSAAEGAGKLLRIPRGHVGPVALPGSGRLVWWTGRVAIGLRHESRREFSSVTQSGLWIQQLLLQRNADTPVAT